MTEDALREKARGWLLRYGLGCYFDADKSASVPEEAYVDRLVALLAAERAEAVTAERWRIDFFVQLHGFDADPPAKDFAECVISFIRSGASAPTPAASGPSVAECERCHLFGRKQANPKNPPHSCPYQKEIHDNYKYQCECCDDCTQECCDDI